MRIDKALVDLGFVETRSQAQALIQQNCVFLFNPQSHSYHLVKQPSLKVSVENLEELRGMIQLKESELSRFVSRAGVKLEGALQKLNFSVSGLVALDVGQSTGGFSDCLLQRGVSQIFGVDVGRDQLQAKISKDPKVEFYEGVNARDLIDFEPLKNQQGKIDLVVMDVSFISMTLILPSLNPFLRSGAHLLSLVKPQFELDKKALNKKGVVIDPQRYLQVEEKVKSHCHKNQLKVLEYMGSTIEGKSGNKEFFVFAQKL